MNVFLPIKPKFAFAILDGKKRYEFRKGNIGQKVKRVVVYASSPYQKIIGYFEVKRIHKDHPEKLWNKFWKFSGIEKEEFFSYYQDNAFGISIEIKKFVSLKKHINPREVFPDFVIPQSFKYLTETEFEVLKGV